MLKWGHSNVTVCKILLINRFMVLTTTIVFPIFFPVYFIVCKGAFGVRQ
jgi:hypothetical protein